MAKHSMQEAADLVGVGRSTIWRMIKKGELSATKNDRNVQEVDSAELFRMFPERRLTTTCNSTVKQDETEMRLLKQENDYLKQIISSKDEVIAAQAQALRLIEYKEEKKVAWWNKKLW